MSGAERHGVIRIGVGGWSYDAWRGTFYPETLAHKRELEYAARRLTSIEINGTYYGSQKPESFARWHDETPDGFVFSVKGPRFATNRRELAGAAASIERFFSSGVMELKTKLGPVNWQFMTTKAFDARDFEAFLELLPGEVDGRPVRHAVEVRHPSFRNPEFVAMARTRGVAVVIAGDSQYPEIADVTAPFVYARIMGTTDVEPLGYSPERLDLWAGRARRWSEGLAPPDLPTVAPPADRVAREVFLYVISGHKTVNPLAAGALIERVGAPCGP
jgi:uncharacterized protein YecE (DUF72 family)